MGFDLFFGKIISLIVTDAATDISDAVFVVIDCPSINISTIDEIARFGLVEGILFLNVLILSRFNGGYETFLLHYFCDSISDHCSETSRIFKVVLEIGCFSSSFLDF